ncbi:MAG: insulinase family protein [Candidatus Pacebacteria bacterium]|nr:insulinase family protein [Candidatus Paceibacterota bacterium]
MSPRRTQAHTTAPSGFKHHGTYHGIEEYELTKNGLQVLYRFDDTAPVAGLMVTYLVGSRHEAVGYTGATHLLEHLMFKGSKNFPPKRGMSALDSLGEKGAKVNASTWLDRTNYYEVLPSEYFAFAVELEADRMRNAILTEKDRAEEMPAVRSEFAMGENDPFESLDKHLWAIAYMAHPYHHSTIGWQSDFENVSIERLREFYDTYYWPNNAVVSVIGNIDRDTALGLVKKQFGVHPRSPRPIPVPYTGEPPQTGRRFVEVQRAGSKNILGMAYKVPEALHADTPALLALATILADGQTSRLYRSLVEKQLCTEVTSTYTPFKDPSLLFIYATLSDGVAHEKVEQIIQKEIEHLTTDGVTQSECTRVVAGIQTDMVFARDGHYATLSALNEAIALGDWRYLFDLPKKLEEVTPEHIRHVSAQYLISDHLSVGYYKARKNL